MSPHIKISYDRASGSTYTNQDTIVTIIKTSIAWLASLDIASSQ